MKRNSNLTRRNFIKTTGVIASAAYLPGVFGNSLPEKKGFQIRATQDTGWNIFKRKGWSTLPGDISVNYDHLDYLYQSGVNWLLVFWTNAPEFSEAWIKASEHAHKIGLKLGRALYAFGGGSPETEMCEPNVPDHLLRPSKRGPKTALCPFDPEAKQWVADSVKVRIQPDIDGIIIEPAAETSRSCLCEQCTALRPYQWNSIVVNFVADELQRIKPGAEVMLHLNAAQKDKKGKQQMSEDLAGLRRQVRHIFGWGTDDEASLTDWLESDRRFDAFTKISRVILFPGGNVPVTPVEERVAKAFRWSKLSADRGKTGYSYDWRYFGGTEWKGRQEKDFPSTRILSKMPASMALMGAAMQDPYLDPKSQRDLIKKLRSTCEWDLEDPLLFYRGII